MQNQPTTFRFSLRALFVCMGLLGVGLLVLRHPHYWVIAIVDLAVSISIVFALVSTLAGMGSHRLFHATYAATALTIFVVSEPPYYTLLLGDKWLVSVYWAMHPGETVQSVGITLFVQAFVRLYVVAVSTAAAYIIPWVVQRGQKPPQP